MKLTEIAAPDFDLAMTLDSGQVFHWEKSAMDLQERLRKAVYVEQGGDVLKVRGGRSSARPGWREIDLQAEMIADIISRSIIRSRTFALVSARSGDERGPGFLSRPTNNSAAAMGMPRHVHLFVDETGGAHSANFASVADRYGERRKIEHHVAHTFPSAQRIAESSESELRKCALGYRAKNLLATARLVGSGEADLDAWSELSDADLRGRLCACQAWAQRSLIV